MGNIKYVLIVFLIWILSYFITYIFFWAGIIFWKWSKNAFINKQYWFKKGTTIRDFIYSIKYRYYRDFYGYYGFNPKNEHYTDTYEFIKICSYIPIFNIVVSLGLFVIYVCIFIFTLCVCIFRLIVYIYYIILYKYCIKYIIKTFNKLYPTKSVKKFKESVKKFKENLLNIKIA